MKPFDLEQAKAGAPIQTRDGTPAKFIAYVPEATESQQVVVLIGNSVRARYPTGTFLDFEGDDDDLFMAPRKRTVWVNLHPYAGKSSYGYPATVYATKEMADAVSDQDRQGNRAWPLEIEE